MSLHIKCIERFLAASSIISFHPSPVLILTSVSNEMNMFWKLAWKFRFSYNFTVANRWTPKMAYKNKNNNSTAPTLKSSGKALKKVIIIIFWFLNWLISLMNRKTLKIRTILKLYTIEEFAINPTKKSIQEITVQIKSSLFHELLK